MKFFRELSLALVLGSTCVANAASLNWITPAIPTSVEILGTYPGTTSPYAESTPYLVVYVSGVQYLVAYNTDKAKAMFEIAKTAFSTGKKLNVYYDADYQLGASLWGCTDISTTGSCIVHVQGTGGLGGFRIQSLSLQ